MRPTAWTLSYVLCVVMKPLQRIDVLTWDNPRAKTNNNLHLFLFNKNISFDTPRNLKIFFKYKVLFDYQVCWSNLFTVYNSLTMKEKLHDFFCGEVA